MSALLEAKEVTKHYTRAQRPSLNKISFSVSKGEFIAIIGASGSGKTTLLNVLSTIDTPTSGSITINGVNLKTLTDTSAADFRRDNLGFIFQEYLLLDSLTIFENIAVPLTLQKLPPKKIETMVRSLAETFGIGPQLDKELFRNNIYTLRRIFLYSYYESKVHFHSKVAMRPELFQVSHHVYFLSLWSNNWCLPYLA